jgi:hypothetical protein
MSSWACDKFNLKLFLPIAVSVFILGLIGSAQDVYAGVVSDSIVWTGEGGDNSYFNILNWRDAITGEHRAPNAGSDIIYIDDKCDDPFLPQFQVDNAEVHMDFPVSLLLFGTIVICSDDTLVIDSGATIKNNSGDSIENAGTLIIDGTLLNTAIGVVDNNGEIINNNLLDNEGTINNNVGGVINNNNGGEINNKNQFTNYGTINNKEGSLIDNDSGTINNNEPDGLIINGGIIDNPTDETINNFGTIINLCNGKITGVQPIDQGDGMTFNRSCIGPLYSIDRSNPAILREIDQTNAQTILEVNISIAGFEPDDIKGGAGLATNLLTGELFALLKLQSDVDGGMIPGSRTLVTIVPETGVATILGAKGNTGDAFAAIAFDSAGNLFGVTGKGANVSHSLFSLSTIDGSATLLCKLENSDFGSALALNSINGILYYGSGNDQFDTIDSTTAEDCVQSDIGLDVDLAGEFNALTFGVDKGLFFAADSFELLTISPNPGEVTSVGTMDAKSKGLAFVPPSEEIPGGPTSSSETSGKGSITSQDPNLGDLRHGRGHNNGFCMNINCITVNGFFNHFSEITVPQGSTQTFTLLINCPRGANTCNHIEIAGALPDSDFYEYQWAATLDRQPRSDNWVLTTHNPFGEIGEVTVTVQTVSQSYISATFNVPFLIPGSIGTPDGIGDPQENNRHLHATIWDNNGGMSNYIFNEGVYVDDIYAYPQVETSYEKPLEVEKLCLNENPHKRYTCAFDMIKQWTIKNAEAKLQEIYDENNYKTDSDLD